MYFGLPDDAVALRDGLRSMLSDACTTSTIRAAWVGDTCDALWKELGGFGLLGLLVPEDRGGLGLDELSFVGALEEAGWHGVPGPLVETVALLPSYDLPVDGSVRLAAVRDGVTPYAGWATHLVSDSLVPAGDLTPVDTVDRTRRAGRVDLPAYGGDVLRPTLGTAAFLLGLARRQLDLTVAYAKDRTQFGVPIGSFQAIKHMLADAALGAEVAWPVVQHAAYALSRGDADAHVRVAHAKAAASDAAYRVSRVCLQAHGAIGYTVEYDLHLFGKRTWALANDWGTAAECRRLVARSLRDE